MTATEPTAVIEFELRGIPGRVLIHFGANDDPDGWGYPLLGLDYPVELARGFPVNERPACRRPVPWRVPAFDL